MINGITYSSHSSDVQNTVWCHSLLVACCGLFDVSPQVTQACTVDVFGYWAHCKNNTFYQLDINAKGPLEEKFIMLSFYFHLPYLFDSFMEQYTLFSFSGRLREVCL